MPLTGTPQPELFDGDRTLPVTSMRAGVPVKVVSERLGHASVAFTQQVYMHVIPGMDEEGAQLAAAAIFDTVMGDPPVTTKEDSPLL